MSTVVWLRALALASCAALAACGGGGGGGGGGGSGPAPTPAANDLGAHVSISSISLEQDIYERGVNDKVDYTLQVDRIPASGVYYYRVTHSDSSKVILFMGDTARADGGRDLTVNFVSGGSLAAGTYTDTITVDVCVDSHCDTPARGSPFVIPVTLKVGFYAKPEADQPQQALLDEVTLPHDLAAAAYSASLDAIVSVSATPSPALNVRSLADGQTRSVALSSAPTSVALSPDGLHAVAGQDGAVTLVDLVPATSGAAMAVKQFPISLPVNAVVLDAQGRVYAYGSPTYSNGVMHWLDTADGVDHTTTSYAYGVIQPVLHPSGNRFYFSSRNVSPTDIYNVTLEATGPRDVVDSPYHGEYDICGQVWTSVLPARLYSACGKLFNSSADASLDMRYAGSFALSASTSADVNAMAAVSISDSQVSNRFVTLEQDTYYCNPRVDMIAKCFTRVGVFGLTDLTLQSRASLAPVTIGTDRFAQLGRYVFFRTNGKAVLLTELRGAPKASSVRLATLP